MRFVSLKKMFYTIIFFYKVVRNEYKYPWGDGINYIMMLQALNSFSTIYRTLFRVRAVLPVALILALAVMALLLPGTVFAGPGSIAVSCGGC